MLLLFTYYMYDWYTFTNITFLRVDKLLALFTLINCVYHTPWHGSGNNLCVSYALARIGEQFVAEGKHGVTRYYYNIPWSDVHFGVCRQDLDSCDRTQYNVSGFTRPPYLLPWWLAKSSKTPKLMSLIIYN